MIQEFWKKYWHTILTWLTMSAIGLIAMSTWAMVNVYYQVKEIEPMIETVRYIQIRQQQHEAVLIQFAKASDDYTIKEILEIINNAPYRSPYDKLD